MGTLANTWLQLGNTSFLSAVVPIIIGGLLAHFKPWLATEDDIRNRINQRRATLIESSCKALHRVLGQVLTIPTAPQLRGEPPNEPDIIGDYVSEIFRTFAVLRDLDAIHLGIKRFYTILFITASVGVLGLLLALPFETLRPAIAIVCYAAIAVQIYAVGAVRSLAKQLERYEQTT